jgi:hypothetical protein
MYCSSCQQKLIQLDKEKNNIWGFNPYLFDTYKGLKEGFQKFYNEINRINNEDFYLCYNDDGYTYSQWHIYIISKNNYKYKNLKKITLWLFQVLSDYSFFQRLISLGKKNDPLHNTLHHYLKFMDNMGFYQKCALKLLLDNQLSLEAEDSDGISANEYLLRKQLSQEDLLITKEITKQYKEEEKILFLDDLFKEDCFVRCLLCNNFINIHENMLENKKKIVKYHNFDKIHTKIESIIKKREDCINIYKKYENCINSTQRHMYVLNTYKEILL